MRAGTKIHNLQFTSARGDKHAKPIDYAIASVPGATAATGRPAPPKAACTLQCGLFEASAHPLQGDSPSHCRPRPACLMRVTFASPN